MGYIYCFKNLINNKVYIGKTVNDPQKRYYQHLHKHINDGTVFHNALKKYGYKEFMFYVIGEFPDNKLNYYENFYIKQFNSHWRDGWGYNMSYGGENSPDILEKRVRAYPLNENLEPIKEKGIIFKSQSEAQRQLLQITGNDIKSSYISQICNGKKYSVFNYTFCFVDENDNDIPTNYKGLKGSIAASKENIKRCHEKISKPVILITPKGDQIYYASIKEAGREEHIDPKTIRKIIEENRAVSSGVHKGWTAKYKEEE